MRVNRQHPTAGFTLVEMLVVIAIIAILAGLLLPAVGMVKNRVIEGRLAIEVQNVDRGMQAYKNENEDFPPNCINSLEGRRLVRDHILKVWPHIDTAELDAVTDLLVNYLDPAEAIPFWLGGFSPNAKSPFLGKGGPLILYSGSFYYNPERNKGLMAFDKGLLTLGEQTVLDAGPPQIVGQLSTDGDNDSFPVYVPKYSQMPLVYLENRTYAVAYYPPTPTDDTGAAKAYLSDRAAPNSPLGYEFINPDSFQIICAGRDNHYGCYTNTLATPVFPRFPSGIGYDPTLGIPAPGLPGVGGDSDNITNFSGGGKLEDTKP